MSVEQITAAIIENVEKIITKLLAKVLKTKPKISESKMPVTPPIKQIKIASMRNCCKIFACLAPIAIRTPISLVRSVSKTTKTKKKRNRELAEFFGNKWNAGSIDKRGCVVSAPFLLSKKKKNNELRIICQKQPLEPLELRKSSG